MTVFEILLKDMVIKSLDHQLKLMALMMVYVDIFARRNFLIYYKETSTDMQNFAVTGISQRQIQWVARGARPPHPPSPPTIFCNRLIYLQSLIVNNAPLTYVCPNSIETCLTPSSLVN